MPAASDKNVDMLIGGQAVISALGIRRQEPVAHGDLEHAHWDRATRTWHTHENEPAVIGRAA